MNIECKYNDSQTANLHKVSASFFTDFLCFVTNGKRVVWPYSEISIESFGSDEYILHFYNETIIIDTKDWELVKRFFPNYKEGLKLSWASYLVLIVSLIALYIISIPLLSKQIANVIPKSIVEQIGSSMAQSLENDSCDFKEQEEIITSEVKRLTGSNHYKIIVIKSPEINAFAVPGGIIVFTTGIIKSLKNEGQLRSVLAHEIIHHKNKHHVRKIVKLGFTSLLWNVTVSSLTGFIAIDPEVIKTLILSSYDAQDEKEADFGAVKLLESKGYSAKGLVEYLEIHKKESFTNKYIERVFSTHPATDDRISYLNKAIKLPPKKSRTFDFEKFQSFDVIERCKKTK